MSATTPRPELPAIPDRMKRLKLDRGYPVPWFVPWVDEQEKEVEPGEGRPVFQLMAQRRFREALRYQLCWNCGDKLGRYKAFVIGPMCLVNRINSEPPSHLDCALFAATGCPFLTRPHARRHDPNIKGELRAAGELLERNPGVTAVYVIEGPYAINGDGKGGVLIELPKPHRVDFYAEGRIATPAEIRESIESGVPLLLDACQTDAERAEVQRRSAFVIEKFAS